MLTPRVVGSIPARKTKGGLPEKSYFFTTISNSMASSRHTCHTPLNAIRTEKEASVGSRRLKRVTRMVLLLSLAVTAPSHGDSWTPSGFDPANPEKSITYLTSDSPSDRVWNSSLTVANDSTKPSFICNSYKDKNCEANAKTRVFAILPVCNSDLVVACIAGLKINSQELENSGLSPILFSEDKERNFPAGSIPSLWRNPQDNKLYLVKVLSYAWPYSQNSSFSVHADVWRVEPVECADCVRTTPIQYSEFSVSTGVIPTLQSSNCVWTDFGICYKALDLDRDQIINLSVQSPAHWFGWVFARMQNSKFKSVLKEDSIFVHTISSKPIQVPVLGANYLSSSEVPAEIITAVGDTNPNYFLKPGVNEVRRIPTYNDFGKKIIEHMGLRPDFSDYLDLVWRFSALSNPSKESSLIALLQTNSLTWDYAIPVYENGEFILKVSGKHFNPDGTIAEGFYQLLIPAQEAYRRWGNLGQEARLAVLYENSSGAATLQTSIIKNEDGWFNATISGYHYSSGTLRFRLEKKASLPENPGMQVPKTKLTITCKKGKSTIKKTSRNPKCPVGYKKIASN